MRSFDERLDPTQTTKNFLISNDRQLTESSAGEQVDQYSANSEDRDDRSELSTQGGAGKDR